MHTDPQYYLCKLLIRDKLWVYSHLHRLIEDAAADLHHLQVLLLFIPGALYVSHPAALVLLAGIDEVAHRAVLVEHLSAHNSNENRVSIATQEESFKTLTEGSRIWITGATRAAHRGQDLTGFPLRLNKWSEWSLTSHIRLLFLSRSTCSGDRTLPVKGPISVPALIQVFEKMPRPSPGIELWAMITSLGSTRLDSFCTSGNKKEEAWACKMETRIVTRPAGC